MHVDYYDKYFSGVEEDIYRLMHPLLLLQKGGAVVQVSPISESVLTRMLTSPFAINIRLNRGDDNEVDECNALLLLCCCCRSIIHVIHDICII